MSTDLDAPEHAICSETIAREKQRTEAALRSAELFRVGGREALAQCDAALARVAELETALRNLIRSIPMSALAGMREQTIDRDHAERRGAAAPGEASQGAGSLALAGGGGAGHGSADPSIGRPSCASCARARARQEAWRNRRPICHTHGSRFLDEAKPARFIDWANAADDAMGRASMTSDWERAFLFLAGFPEGTRIDQSMIATLISEIRRECTSDSVGDTKEKK